MLKDVSVKPRLSPRAQHAFNIIEKYGEMLLDPNDGFFKTPSARSSVNAVDMMRLQRFGLVRIDCVGESSFAVFLRSL